MIPVHTISEMEIPEDVIVVADTTPRDAEEKNAARIMPFLAYVAWLAEERPARVQIIKKVSFGLVRTEADVMQENE